MRTVSRLLMLVALALAAMALTAGVASAQATETVTIVETGDWTATQRDPFQLSNDNMVITCTTSTASGTVTTAGVLTVEALTFGSCTETIGNLPCLVTTDDLPNTFTVTVADATTPAETTPRTGNVTSDATNNPFASATISCGIGMGVCTVTTSTAFTAELANSVAGDPGTSGVLRITGEEVAVTGCGEAATWTSSWTIDTTADPDTDATTVDTITVGQ
jgi:hypothetical protein